MAAPLITLGIGPVGSILFLLTGGLDIGAAPVEPVVVPITVIVPGAEGSGNITVVNPGAGGAGSITVIVPGA